MFMKKIFIASIFILCALQGPARAQDNLNPAGVYSISRGVSPGNIEYTGKVTILRYDQMGDRYAVFWKIPGYAESRGIGLMNQGKLVVAYSTSSSADFGLVVYKIDGGTLTGRWVTPKRDLASGHEQLEGPAGLNGTYSVNGQSKNTGDTYSGTMEIRPSGDVYDLTWFIDEYMYTGVGIKEGNYLVAAWGPDAGIVSYDIKGTELLGRWAAPGDKWTGVEDLARVKKNTASAGVTTPSPITFDELTKRIEKALAQINTMTFDEVMRYRPPGADHTKNTDLIKDKCWYKKPGLHRSESVTLYMPSGPQNHVYVGKLEGGNYNSYELLTNGSVEKSSFAVEGWDNITPGRFYMEIKKRIKDGNSYSLEFDQNRNVYVLTFSSPDEPIFEVAGDSWLPYFVAVYDQKNNSIVEIIRSNIQINPKIPDEIFLVPEGIEKK